MMTTNTDLKPQAEATDCPRCHATKAFRKNGVLGQYWTKRCINCKFKKNFQLPAITKQIVYLDQFVISNMVKAKDPFWSNLETTLGNLVALQLIVCPYSDIHMDESVLKHDLREPLRQMYRSFGGNDSFRFPYFKIERSQLLRSIKRFLGIDESNSLPVWREAFDRDPHHWTADSVFADFPANETWITDLRNRKEAVHSDMHLLCDYWKANPRSFDEDAIEEIKGYARHSLMQYRDLADGSFNPSIPPGLQPRVRLIHALAVEVHKERPDEADPVSVVEAFFDSPHAIQTPFLDISSHLWATIAQRVRSKKGSRKPKLGDCFDVAAISSYAPYCDAMFVDREVRCMASEGNVDVPGKYNVRLFSVKTQSEFLKYLSDILRNMSDAHLEGLSLVHPHLAPVLPYLHRMAK